ncbi:50S ribosomal protein L9 [Senna tora]|uniref:Large ribosomal subunit protein bL9c n=1 Tax=Senna tora TaxID=362788 RepID=A0A834TQ77_9FABA|nr:50S ribosomal protein L9 [Senna tora]
MGYLSYGRHALQQIIRNSKPRSSSQSVANPLLFACQGLRYRKLEVILTTSMDKLGKAGETVKVAPGFFRNHLMPKLLAVPNIDKFAYLIREQRKIYQPVEEEEQEEVKESKDSKEDKMREYEKAAIRLAKAKLVLRRFIDAEKAKSRATKEEPLELRSAVTKEDLVAEVARQLFVNIVPDNLHLPMPLTRVGEYEVPLRLPRSIPLPEGMINWSLKVKIRSE